MPKIRKISNEGVRNSAQRASEASELSELRAKKDKAKEVQETPVPLPVTTVIQ